MKQVRIVVTIPVIYEMIVDTDIDIDNVDKLTQEQADLLIDEFDFSDAEEFCEYKMSQVTRVEIQNYEYETIYDSGQM